MKKKQKESNKGIVFFSLFSIIILFCFGFYFYPLPPSTVVAQINSAPVPALSPILNEPANKLDKQEKQILNKQKETLDKTPKKLKDVINLINKTAIGRDLSPFINELLIQNKIHLTPLQDGHYGESGEGCVVKNGEYFFEGFFILLSDQLSIEETASTLVHEATHYLMIQKNIASAIKPQFPVIFFEISAFAVQHQFITELQQLDLADPQAMFIGESKIIQEIMQNSYDYKKTASQATYIAALRQLVEYGYPLKELNRVLTPLSEKECTGLIN